ncbi:redoxin domain-containing protein [Parabacteroides sp. OttesenSCG-928-O15]|nr:redoxin domain-containing protein [Parabacteroides sp. OttesenSCG-928-O15]
MRRIIVFVWVLCVVVSFSAKGNRVGDESKQFTIIGEIKGLVPGDTLSFEKVILPYYGEGNEKAFQVIVSEPDRFVYSGSHPHTQYYSMTYKPLVGKWRGHSKVALPMIVDEGELRITGVTEHIYYCRLSSRLYDEPLLKEMLQLEDSVGMIRAEYGKIIDEAREAGDMERAKEYTDKFNFFSRDHQETYTVLKQKKAELMEKNPYSQWMIVDLLQTVFYTPLEKLTAYIENMEPEAAASFYGSLLKQEVETMTKLAPGNDAPDFTVTTVDGKRITSANLRGKYVLFYRWGLCPGSIMIDIQITEFYEKYKEHLILIGMTDDIESIRQLNETTKEEDELMGIKLKPVFENMAAHPWPEVELKGDNHQITVDFAFAGLPYFVLLSPEGKILARDFHEAYGKAKEIISAAFPD